MGITTAMCTSFKSELLGGTHDLDTHTLKLALKIPLNNKVIGHVGRYGKAKNHNFIINMFITNCY